MNPTHIRRAARLWGQGALLLALRAAQNLTGFDPETGLSRPSMAGTVLSVCLLVCAAVELILCLRLPKRKCTFPEVFTLPEGVTLYLLIFGSLALMAGGVLLAVMTLDDIPTVVCGVVAAAAGAGMLFHVKRVRAGEKELSVIPLLPVLLFSVFFLLAVYMPHADDPVLARFYLPVLAAALNACALSRVSAFIRKDASVAGFSFTANMAVLTSLASIADEITSNVPLALLYAGVVLILSAFIAMRKDNNAADNDAADNTIADNDADNDAAANNAAANN